MRLNRTLGRHLRDFRRGPDSEREREVPIIRVDSSIVIDRPPEEVFAYATDPAHTPEWQSSALETSVDGPVQAGASGKEVRRFRGRRMESRRFSAHCYARWDSPG